MELHRVCREKRNGKPVKRNGLDESFTLHALLFMSLRSSQCLMW